ncbi:M81 family metallopeptidase [Salaquimonas pukyongi]|nr:M81 family metallopeptidase [Salaquimonas pukyongi]
MTRTARIAIAGFQHETNTFAPMGAPNEGFLSAIEPRPLPPQSR